MRFALFVILIASSSTVFSQSWRYYRHELMLGLGASNFLGDLGGNDGIGLNGIKSVRDLEFALTRPVVHLGYRYKFTQSFAVRVSFFQARVEGDDAKTQDLWRNNRNLHFKSPISELSVNAEIYPFTEMIDHRYRMTGVRGRKVRQISPYFFGGFGLFYFNPKSKFERNGSWQKLHQYRTEGVQYNRLSFAASYGGGIKYSIDKQWSLGFEFGMRKTFTDYIDDVSTVYADQAQVIAYANNNGLDPNAAAYFADPNLNLPGAIITPGPFSAGQQRGDSADLDSYMFAIISIHYRLLKGRINLPKF